MGFDFSIPGQAASIDIGLGGTLLGVLIIGVTAVALTRNTRHILLSLFPLSMGYRAIGLETSYLIIVALGILWAVTLVGTHSVGNMITSIGSTIKETVYVPRKEKPYREIESAYNISRGQVKKLRHEGYSALEIDNLMAKKAAATTLKGTKVKTLDYNTQIVPAYTKKQLKEATQAAKAIGYNNAHKLRKQTRIQTPITYSTLEQLKAASNPLANWQPVHTPSTYKKKWRPKQKH